MNDPISAEKMLEVLEQVVEETGREYVYERGAQTTPRLAGEPCLYVHLNADNQLIPGCIAGRVLARLGAPMSYLIDNEGASADYVAQRSGLNLTKGAATVLRAAQIVQDHHRTYGEALEVAQRVAGGLERGATPYGVLSEVYVFVNQRLRSVGA